MVTEQDRIKAMQDYILMFIDPEEEMNEENLTTKCYESIANVTSQLPRFSHKKITALNYKIFLETYYWKIVSTEVKKRADKRCQLCNSSYSLQVHHRTYDHHGSEALYMNDLICLCKKCHETFHMLDE